MAYRVHCDSFAFTIGYFEFRLCEHNNMTTRANQSCFDNGLFLTVHGTGKTRYDINGNQQPEYHFKLDKPRDVTCTQCILQWKYNAGLYILY